MEPPDPEARGLNTEEVSHRPGGRRQVDPAKGPNLAARRWWTPSPLSRTWTGPELRGIFKTLHNTEDAMTTKEQTNGTIDARLQELDNRERAAQRTGVPFDRELLEARGLAKNLEVATAALSNALALLGREAEDRPNLAHALQLVTHADRKAAARLKRLGLDRADQEGLAL